MNNYDTLQGELITAAKTVSNAVSAVEHLSRENQNLKLILYRLAKANGMELMQGAIDEKIIPQIQNSTVHIGDNNTVKMYAGDIANPIDLL